MANPASSRLAAIETLRPAVAERVPEALRMFALLCEEQGLIQENPDAALSLLEEAATGGDEAAAEALVDRFWALGACDLWRAGAVPGEPARTEAIPPAMLERALHWSARLWPTPADAPPRQAYRCGVLLLRLRRRDALAWLESAHRRGMPRATYLLGLLHIGPSFVEGLAPLGEGPRGRWLPRSYKKAARYLEAAAAIPEGFAEAEMALSVLYGLRGFVQRDLLQSRLRIERAAQLGHGMAQLRHAQWLLKQGPGREVEAVYCLRQALASRCPGTEAAGALLQAWVTNVDEHDPLRQRRLAAAEAMTAIHPALARRMALAACFDLRRHEMLLLDVLAADRGEVLLVDVRTGFRNARRRLIAVQDEGQCDAVARARLLALDEVTDVAGDHTQRLRLFRACCQKGGMDGSLFEP